MGVACLGFSRPTICTLDSAYATRELSTYLAAPVFDTVNCRPIGFQES